VHLVEMLVVIAILSVLLAVGWPALRPVLLRQRADALQLPCMPVFPAPEARP